MLRVPAFFYSNSKCTDDRADDSGCSNKDGKEYGVSSVVGQAEHHGTDEGADVRLKEVRAHTRNVTNVVTNVVSDNCWVSGVVLRKSGLYLADQVSAHISGLGVDSTADACEESDG